jgi:broad specificity phosphatase PhoE
VTLISHAATEAQRRAAFPLDEPVLEPEVARITALRWVAPRTQQTTPRILSAPERRAQETAQALGLSAVIAPELRDCDYGQWRGLDLAQLQADDPDGVAAWLADPHATPHGGESIVNLIGRVGRWLDEQSDAGYTLAVTHPAVIRSAVVHALRAPAEAFWRIDIAPLSLTDLRFNGKAWTLRSTACALGKLA